MNYNLSENIRVLVSIHNLNQSEFGKLIGSNGNSVSNWINGVAKPPLDKVIAISKHFKISLDSLIFGRVGQANGAYDNYTKENHPHLLQDENGDYKKEVELKPDSGRNEETMGKLVRWLLDNDKEVMQSAIYSIYISAKQKDYLDKFLKNDSRDDLMK